jgi:hypothetical protein
VIPVGAIKKLSNAGNILYVSWLLASLIGIVDAFGIFLSRGKFYEGPPPLNLLFLLAKGLIYYGLFGLLFGSFQYLILKVLTNTLRKSRVAIDVLGYWLSSALAIFSFIGANLYVH